MNQQPTQYEQGGLPMPKNAGNMAALQQYFGQSDVRKRVAFRLNNDPERADRVLANLYEVIETSKNPSMLLKCDPRSIITTCVQAEQLGISIDARQLAYPVPRYNKDKGVTECNMQIGWRGYVARLKGALRGCEVIVELVYEGDEFKIIGEGVRQSYIHEPADPFADGNQGDSNCKGGYCYIEWIGDDGDRKSICGRMSIGDIEKARKTATTDMVWKQWWGEQAKKTVIKRTCKVQFSSITGDLDAVDNEDYDVENVKRSSGRASAEDIDKKMRQEDEKKDSEGEDDNQDTVSEGENVTDIDPETGDVVTDEAVDESRSADDLPTEDVISEEATPVATASPEGASTATQSVTTETSERPTEEGEASEITCPEDAPMWDGRSLVIQGKVIQKEFNGISPAVKYLSTIIAKRTDKAARKSLLEENIALTNTLVTKNLMNHFDELHKLVAEGEDNGQ